jgi:hypothetical protein
MKLSSGDNAADSRVTRGVVAKWHISARDRRTPRIGRGNNQTGALEKHEQIDRAKGSSTPPAASLLTTRSARGDVGERLGNDGILP